MASGLCKLFLNLNISALDSKHWRKSGIHSFALRKSAERCPYCGILWDGLKAFELHESPMVFTYSTYRSFCLTKQSFLASYGLGAKLEYYLAPQESQRSDLSSRSSEEDNKVSLDLGAIRQRPVIGRFWTDVLRD